MNLRELGLNLIPCKDNSKLPSIPWKEYQTETYKGNLATNNAVVCGLTSGNLVVIDLDDPSLATLIFKDFEALKKKTLVVATGKKGHHIYIRNQGVIPKTMRLSLPDGRHVDIQSQGAYVVAPESIHPDTGRKYEIISSTTEIMESNFDGLFKQLVELGFKGATGSTPLVDVINGVQEGNRNNSAFRYCAFLISNLNLPDDMVFAEILRWNTFLPQPLPTSEIEATYKSAIQRVQRPTNDTVEFTPEKLYKLRDLSAVFEGMDITFGAMIARIGELNTVTVEGIAKCPNCLVNSDIKGDGYMNPNIPKCSKCRVKLNLVVVKNTTDMKELYLQELQEDVNHNNPLVIKARVIGKDVNRIGTAQRKRITATFKSFKTEKNYNEVVLLVKTIDDLEESVEVTLPYDKIIEYKDKLKDPEFQKHLINSLAPHIQGHHRIKESLMYLAVSGSIGATKRTRLHIALAGNKSKGKSELLDELAKLTGGSYVVGISATKAGLGTGMIKLSDGTSISKAGPLVTNSGRSLSLDELDKMGSEDTKALYDCMEQGIVTSAKASLGGEERLIADTSICAALNFKYGDYDSDYSILENINLYPALLSRFALIFKITEYSDIETQMIASKVLGLTTNTIDAISARELRLFINTVKIQNPQLSTEAKQTIHDFFINTTKKVGKDKLPIEVRQLHDLVRLTTARAKLLMKEEADKDDAEHIINLFKEQLQGWGITLDGKGKQTALDENEQMGREHHLLTLFKEACIDGIATDESILKLWENTNHFSSRREAKLELEKWQRKRKVMLNKNGDYYLSKEVL